MGELLPVAEPVSRYGVVRGESVAGVADPLDGVAGVDDVRHTGVDGDHHGVSACGKAGSAVGTVPEVGEPASRIVRRVPGSPDGDVVGRVGFTRRDAGPV